MEQTEDASSKKTWSAHKLFKSASGVLLRRDSGSDHSSGGASEQQSRTCVVAEAVMESEADGGHEPDDDEDESYDLEQDRMASMAMASSAALSSAYHPTNLSSHVLVALSILLILHAMIANL